MTLYKQHAKTEWISVLVWSVCMGLTVMYTPIMWEQMRESGALAVMEEVLAGMPDYLAGLYGNGGGFVELDSFLQFYAFGSWLISVGVIFTGLFVTGMVTREMDRRTMEFLLALPVSRWEIIVSRWVNLLLALVIFQGAQWLGVVGGMLAIGQEPAYLEYALIELNTVLLYLAIGSLLLVPTILVDDYGRGLAVTLGGGLGVYLLHMTTSRSTGFMKDLRSWLPFEWLDPGRVLIQGEVPWNDMAILAAIAVAGLGLSVWLFQRKQITV